jgi:hypothetical protein
MDLPFTTEQFLNVFRDYNTAIWPIQIVAYVLGLGAIGLAVRRSSWSSRVIGLILAAFWLWMGTVYHLTFFRTINQAALLFGAFFLLQGLAFLVAGVRDTLRFFFRSDLYGWIGGLFVVYALAIYPIIGAMLGHGYPQAPMFGVAPCPTTIFTFGLLLWTTGRVPGGLLVIPTLWALIGFSAALTLGIIEDTGLLVAGVTGTGFLLYRNRREPGRTMEKRVAR